MSDEPQKDPVSKATYERVAHFKGVVQIPVASYLDAIGDARYTVVERKPDEPKA